MVRTCLQLYHAHHHLCTWHRCCCHIPCRTFPTTVVFELDDIAVDQVTQPENPLELPSGPVSPSSTMVTHSPATSRPQPPQQSSSAGAWERTGGFIDLFGSNVAVPRRPISTAASSLQPALQPVDPVLPPPIAVAAHASSASESALQHSGPHDSPQTPPPRSVILPPPPFSPPPEFSLSQSNISMVNTCSCHVQDPNHQLIHRPAVSVTAAPSTASARVCWPGCTNGHGCGKGGQRRDYFAEWQKNARDLRLQREYGI